MQPCNHAHRRVTAVYPPATAPAPALSHLYIVVSYLLANRLVQAVNVNLVRKRRRLCEMAFMGGGGGGY